MRWETSVGNNRSGSRRDVDCKPRNWRDGIDARVGDDGLVGNGEAGVEVYQNFRGQIQSRA